MKHLQDFLGATLMVALFILALSLAQCAGDLA